MVKRPNNRLLLRVCTGRGLDPFFRLHNIMGSSNKTSDLASPVGEAQRGR